MFQLKLTKRVQNVIGIPPKNVKEPSQIDTKYGDWYVNVFDDGSIHYFVFMNEKTLLSFLLFSSSQVTPEKLFDCFLGGLAQLLRQENVAESKISDVLSHHDLCAITKTDNKKALGNMNDLVFHYQVRIDDDGGIDKCDVGEIIKSVNRMPQRNISWGHSIDLFLDLIDSGKTA